MREFLVATDLSTRSEAALRRAEALASAQGAGLVLAHAVDDDQPASVVAAHRREAERLLAEAASRTAARAGTPCRSLVTLGDPAEALAAAAAAEGAALIVLGPHRRRAVRDFFLGATGERVIRAATTPVLSVHADPSRPWRAMLLALDGSEASRSAVEAVRTLAFLPPRAVTAFAAAEPVEAGFARIGGANPAELAALARAATEAARAQLTALLPRGGFPCEVEIVPGDAPVADLVLAAAARRGCDVIALGTTGRGGVAGAFLGSVAARVLTRADVDVLVAPRARAVSPASGP